MKRSLFACMMFVGMTSTLLTGCMESVDAYDPNAVQERYDAQWEKIMGEIDPNQDWNTSTRCTANVSVSFSGNYTAKIYTADPRNSTSKAYLLGQMEVRGGQTASLQMDMPNTQSEVFVALFDADNGAIVKSATIQNNQINIQFGGANTREVVVNTSNDYVTDAGEKIFPLAAYNSFLSLIPEGDTTNGSKEGVHSDFVYKSNGTFSVYAIYKVTSQTPSIGIEYKTPTSSDWVKAELFSSVGNIIAVKEFDWGVQECNWYWSDAALKDSDVKYFKCNGVSVNLPVGTNFRFYMYANSTDWYSDASLNPGEVSHFATFNNGYAIDGKQVLFVGGEDSPNASDYDLNDVVCAFVGDVALPDIIDKNVPAANAQPWIIACEDLGGTGDFDFNDIVFSVSHAAGTTEATVTPLAAGGIYAAYIYYNGAKICENNEIHAMLGKGLEMTNTYSRGTPGTPVTITVPEDYSVSDHKFTIEVRKDENTYTVTHINQPGRGETPQMIVIDGSADWAWPIENCNISLAYTGFGEWGANYGNTTWYLNPTAKKVVE